jgi:hypothetical protein
LDKIRKAGKANEKEEERRERDGKMMRKTVARRK